MTSRGSTRPRVVVLVLPEVNLLDLAGPVQVFGADALADGGYRIEYVASGGAVRSAQGLTLAELGPLPSVGPGDLVLIPGPRLRPPSGDEPLVRAEVIEWVRAADAVGAQLAAVCSGAVVLGEAGLLDGRRCTTHWALLEAMRQRYPRARVASAVLYVHDGRISTSAGISAGVDLALSLVERREGPATAAAVARELVLFMRRPGGHGQLSPFLQYRDHINPLVHQLQDHLAQHLDTRLTLLQLAALSGVSARTLTRAFVAATGLTPFAYQEHLRLSTAAALLAQPERTVEQVAADCGYADARQLRRTVRRRFGVSPSQLRVSVGAVE